MNGNCTDTHSVLCSVIICWITVTWKTEMEMEGHVMDLKYVCYNDWDKMCGN